MTQLQRRLAAAARLHYRLLRLANDVPRGAGRFGLTAQHALIDGQPITGRVTTTKQIDLPASILGPFDGSSPECGYPALDIHEPGATLKVSDDPRGPAQIVRASAGGSSTPIPSRCPGGFEPGKTYELAYTAIGAPITGIGFLALRDLLAVHALRARIDRPDRLRVGHGWIANGRFLRQMLYGGFCEDEHGRLVLDGMLAIAAGARMTEANWRFGQPSTQGPKSAVFPFTDTSQTDPVSGHTDGLMRRAIAGGKLPKVMYLNNVVRVLQQRCDPHISAALSHVTSDGTADVDVPA